MYIFFTLLPVYNALYKIYKCPGVNKPFIKTQAALYKGLPLIIIHIQ